MIHSQGGREIEYNSQISEQPLMGILVEISAVQHSDGHSFCIFMSLFLEYSDMGIILHDLKAFELV